MHNETNLIEALKTALEGAFSPFRSTYSTQPVASKQIGLTQPVKAPPMKPPTPPASDSPPARRASSPASNEIDQETPPVVATGRELGDSPLPSPPEERPRQKSVAISLEPRQLTLDASGASWALRDNGAPGQPKKKRKISFEGAPSKRAAFSQVVKSFAANDGQTQLELRLLEKESSEEEPPEGDELEGIDVEMQDGSESPADRRLCRRASSEEEDVASLAHQPSPPDIDEAPAHVIEDDDEGTHAEVPHMPPSSPLEHTNEHPLHRSSSAEQLLDEHLQELAQEGSAVIYDDSVFEAVSSRSLAFDLDAIKLAWSKPAAASSPKMQQDDADALEVELAGLSVDDAEAEAALSRIVSQADFTEMTVVGQFNLGCVRASFAVMS